MDDRKAINRIRTQQRRQKEKAAREARNLKRKDQRARTKAAERASASSLDTDPAEHIEEAPYRTCKLSRHELLEMTKPSSDEKYGILDWCPGCLHFNHYCMVMTHPPLQGTAAPSAPPVEKFQDLLGPDILVTSEIMNLIISNGWLSSRLAVLHTPEQAFSLWNDVNLIPTSLTRAEVLQSRSVSIDGMIPFRGAQTATFHYAFDRGVPKVLKIPAEQGKVAQECRLFEAIGSEAEACGIALVPIECLKLRGSSRKSYLSPEFDVTKGILMPHYCCTLADIPCYTSYVADLWVRPLASKIGEALAFIHNRGWIHGDVKPANIFIDTNSNIWLGDYGSSVNVSDISNYTGGTPKYQLIDVSAEASGRIDRVGLALTILTLLDLEFPSSSSTTTIYTLIDDRVKDPAIKDMLFEFIL